MSDFDWSDEKKIVLKNVDAIAVYTNQNGDAVVRQQGYMGDDDDWVVIPIDRVKDLIAALENLLE